MLPLKWGDGVAHFLTAPLRAGIGHADAFICVIFHSTSIVAAV